ncbi:MAG: HXXEE domain-containing protein [Pseudomonadota bacterium]
MLQRLERHWVYGGAMLAFVLLALMPLLTQDWPVAEILVFLALPAYMLHQWEEHDGDRFRSFVNRRLAGGAEGLSLRDVFLINVVFVWWAMAGILWLMRAVDPGWGVMAGYFLLINGAAHLGQLMVLRVANPGIYTGAALFLPLGAAILWSSSSAGLGQHFTSIATVLGLHALIVVRVVTNMRATPGAKP